jgi:hypothetical protein
VPIHDIQVQQIRPTLQDGAAVIPHAREVRGQDGGRDERQPRRVREEVGHGKSLSGRGEYDLPPHRETTA